MNAPSHAALPSTPIDLPWTAFSEENAVKAYLACWMIFWAAVLVLSLLRWGFMPVVTLLNSTLAACGRIADRVYNETVAVGFLAMLLQLGFCVAPLILYAGIPFVGYHVGQASISFPLMIVDERKDEPDFGWLGRFKDEVPPTKNWYSQSPSWMESLTVAGICRLGLMPMHCTPWLLSTEESRPSLHIVNMLVTDLALRELGTCNEPRHAGSYACRQESETRKHGWLHRFEASSQIRPALLKKEIEIRRRNNIDPDRVFAQLEWRPGAQREFKEMAGFRHADWFNLLGLLAAAATLVLSCGIIAGKERSYGA